MENVYEDDLIADGPMGSGEIESSGNLERQIMEAEMEEVLEDEMEGAEQASNLYYEDASSNGQPQEQEIEDYARFLGMDPSLKEDQQLMWIARKGLMEPVPEPWQALKDASENIIYYNKKTQVQS